MDATVVGIDRFKGKLAIALPPQSATLAASPPKASLATGRAGGGGGRNSIIAAAVDRKFTSRLFNKLSFQLSKARCALHDLVCGLFLLVAQNRIKRLYRRLHRAY